MRTFFSMVVLSLLVTPASAVPLRLVQVSAGTVSCMFDTDCRIVVNDFTDDFVMPGTTGQGLVLSRRFPMGQPGTAGAGLYAYMYRLDLRTLIGTRGSACIDAFRIDFGTIIPLDYNGNGTLDHGFVLSRGSTGTVTPTSAEQIGDSITFRFRSPLCPGQGGLPGDDSFFFGLASRQDTTAVTALLRTPSNTIETAVAKAPVLPVEVNCDAGHSLTNALRTALPGAIIHVTGTCHETVTFPTHQIAVVGVGPATIVGNSMQPVVTIDGRSGIVLKHVTLQGGLHGLRVTGGRDVTFVGVQTERNVADGMQIEAGAQVRCADCSALANGKNGFTVHNKAAVTFFGTTESLDNLGHGMQVSDAISSFRAHDGLVLATSPCVVKHNGNTGGDGLWVDRSTGVGQYWLHPGCVFTAQGNRDNGIRFTGASSGKIHNATMYLQCNGRSGMAVVGSSGVLSEGSKIRAKKNAQHGIRLSETAFFDLDFDEGFNSALRSQVCSLANTLAGLKRLHSSTVDCDPTEPTKAAMSLQPGDALPPGCVSQLPPAWCSVALTCSAP